MPSIPCRYNILIYPYNTWREVHAQLQKEIFNDLICEIDNDEQNIEKLMPYSLTELNYSIDWLNIKIQRVKSRINDFFGEKLPSYQ
jgi:pimeloyl-CoA synthetase